VKNGWFLGKLAKESLKLSFERDPVEARTSTSEPRVPFFVMGTSDDQQHGDGRVKCRRRE
jgi:hypothetical protein